MSNASINTFCPVVEHHIMKMATVPSPVIQILTGKKNTTDLGIKLLIRVVQDAADYKAEILSHLSNDKFY